MQAWFPDEISNVAPGDNLRLVLTVENPAPHTDTFTITPSGINVSWVTVAEPSVTIAGGMSRVVDVWIHPPRLATTSAGRHEVSVRIIAESEPSVALTSDAVVVVAPFDDRTVHVLQPVVRGRRRAAFEILLQNAGNDMATCRLRLVDPTHRVEGMFDPPTVGVPPGEAATARLVARASGWRFRRSERVLQFEIDASEADHANATASASMLQVPSFSGSWLKRVVAVGVVVAGLVLGWVLIARNWIDDRVDSAVNSRVAAIQVDDKTGVTQVVPATVPSAAADAGQSVASDATGAPMVVRLAPTPEVGATANDQFKIDDKSSLFITDLVLQNPTRDAGRAVLSIGGEVVYEWDLGDMARINEFQPRVTPLPVPAGSELQLAVNCETAGNNEATACSAALLVTGRLVDETETRQ